MQPAPTTTATSKKLLSSAGLLLFLAIVLSASSTATPVFHKAFPAGSSIDIGLFQVSGCDDRGSCITKQGCLKYQSVHDIKTHRRSTASISSSLLSLSDYPTPSDVDALCSNLQAGQAFSLMADVSALSQFVEMCIILTADNNKVIKLIQADYGPSFGLGVSSWVLGYVAIAVFYYACRLPTTSTENTTIGHTGMTQVVYAPQPAAVYGQQLRSQVVGYPPVAASAEFAAPVSASVTLTKG
ncbi:hypothetical protein HDU76_007075 [Blyttiomyces sp. JEL0837]|nr:hypothetical protein HDU76_007075 [Blyttiomyces sp. JEL0837]